MGSEGLLVQNKNRIVAFDIFRGIGIVFMVMGHIVFGMGFDKYIHAFHMPMFFFVSGYFYRPDKYNSIVKFILHEMKTLLIPYLVFFIMYQFLHYIYTQEFSISYSVLSFFTSNANRVDVAGALWFLLCLFTAKIIFYIISKIPNAYIRLIVVIAVTLIGNSIYYVLPLCLDSAMSCMLIMYVGFLMGKSNKKNFIMKFNSRNVLILSIIFVFNIVLIMLNGDINVRRNIYAIIPLTWFNCIIAIVCYLNISFWIELSGLKIIVPLKKSLVYIGKNSIVFLVLNELIIYLVGIVLRIMNFSTMDNMVIIGIYKIMSLISVLIILSVIAEIINRTKLRIFIGKF